MSRNKLIEDAIDDLGRAHVKQIIQYLGDRAPGKEAIRNTICRLLTGTRIRACGHLLIDSRKAAIYEINPDAPVVLAKGDALPGRVGQMLGYLERQPVAHGTVYRLTNERHNESALTNPAQISADMLHL